MNNSQLLLLDWMRKIHKLEYAHCYQSLFYARLEKRTGILSFVLTTTVAFTYRFPFIKYPYVKEYILPLVAFIVAILAAYQAFIKPGEKSEIHRKLGLEYEKIRHDIEQLYLLASDPQNPEIESRRIEIKSRWDAMNTIYVKDRYFNKAEKKVDSFKKYPKELDFIPDRRQ